MNGIAQLAAQAGYTVSGSDRSSNSDLFQNLKNLGIEIFSQDGSGITASTDFVVYSTAIEPSNPDIQQSKLLGIPLLHRADMLAKLCESKEVIAIAGTAGKSTVTGLLGWIFQCLGKDPTVYCGAPVLNWKNETRSASAFNACAGSPSLGNVQYGSGPWIIEADESDKSFLKFHPAHAIITNIAEDHFSLDELHRLFAQFKSQVSGIVVESLSTFQPFNLPPALLGKHNIENVNHVLTLCNALDLDMPTCIEAVSTFKGIERRLERIGPNVIDDFAHSPVKIAAALEAVSEIWPAFNAVWRPHGYTPLFNGLTGFIEAFSSVPIHTLFILPVYYAGGTVDIKITSQQFVDKLVDAGLSAEFVDNFSVLEKRLTNESLPVLSMGARDPELPLFARRLASKRSPA